MKKILYATDYSQNSISALQLAHKMAKKFEANLIVMHVFDVPISLASPVSLTYLKKEKRLFVEHRAKLKSFCAEKLGDSFDKSEITFLVEENVSVPNGILEKAFKLNVDLIVVGTKGASQIREFILGSTPKALINKSSCPVLVVPAKLGITLIKKIIYATDFEQADIFAIKRLVKIARKLNAEIRVIHISTEKDYKGKDQMEWFKEMLQEQVAYDKLEFILIFSDTIFEELVWFLEDSEADLLAMLERKESTVYQKYFQTDMVNKMIKNITIPVLSYSTGGL